MGRIEEEEDHLTGDRVAAQTDFKLELGVHGCITSWQPFVRCHNEGLICYINKPRQQHVASPSTPVCPFKGQNKIRTALFSWKGHGVSLPGHLLGPYGMLSKARQCQDLGAGLNGGHQQPWGLIKHQLDPASLSSLRHTLLPLACSKLLNRRIKIL